MRVYARGFAGRDDAPEFSGLLTDVNYTAYFLCAKYASAVMKLAHSFDPERYSTLSRLTRSRGWPAAMRIFAYAGSRSSAGIGLTGEFAPIAPYKIKVNRLVRGNFP